jgi:DNA polymerase-3 subunit delta'
MLIGQERLKQVLIGMSEISYVPKFVLIVGSKGSGKRTVVKWFMKYSSINSEIIEDQKVDSVRQVIESSLTLSSPKTFIFPDVQDMTPQAQNAFLKTLEEPSKNAYYIMTVNNLSNVLGTIRSRAVVLQMDGYSREELSHFTGDEALLDMCSTPGQIERFLSFDYESFISHCDKVVRNIGRINVGNIFNILKQIKEDQYDLLIPTLQYSYRDMLLNGESVIRQLKLLQETSTLLEHSTTVNTRNALETMLMKLWEVS